MGYIVFTRFNLEYYFKITFVYTLNHTTLPYIQLIWNLFKSVPIIDPVCGKPLIIQSGGECTS